MNEKPMNMAQAIQHQPAMAAFAAGERAEKPQPRLADIFNDVAKKAGKTTISQFDPNGGVMVWVTPEESDPINALLAAAVHILAKRGQADGRVQVRRMGIAAPGAEVFWQVTDEDGVVIASGFVANEQLAAEEIAKHVKLPTARECPASGEGHRFGPHGMNGEMQCEYCGERK